jgi:hypothetical protein
MKKNKLVIDYDYDFELMGVSSSVRGYKLAWEINRLLNIHLVKQPDLVVGFKNDEEKSFSFYAFETPLNRLKLFKNKPSFAETALEGVPAGKETGKYFLIPEFPHFDFIILAAMEDHTQQQLIALIRSIPSVQLAASIPMEGLKSKSNFIF